MRGVTEETPRDDVFNARNPLEEALIASMRTQSRAPLLAALGNATVFVPKITPDEQRRLTFPLMQHEGRDYIPVFSSRKQARLGAPDHEDYLTPTGGQLVLVWPENVGMLINPGGQLAAALSYDDVKSIRVTGELSIPAGTDLKVGLLEEEPADLAPTVTRWASGQPEVQAVHRAYIEVDNGSPQLVLGVELAPGADAETVIGSSAEALPGVAIMALEPDAEDPISNFMRERDEPLYRR
jgi:hypothetical protein